MSWSKVKKGHKPLWWWFHKIMCELSWSLRNKHEIFWNGYYFHLNKMVAKYHINLYGKLMIVSDTKKETVKAGLRTV